MSFYIRATGINRYAGGGTAKWLKIRNIRKTDKYYEIEVRIWGRKKYVSMTLNELPKYLEFARGWPSLQPVSHRSVIAAYMRVTQ